MEIKKPFTITRVCTKNIVTDAFQGLRNLFGFRLRGYEEMINKYLEEVIKEMDETYIVDWWRFSINPLTAGAVMITVYGDGVRKDAE